MWIDQSTHQDRYVAVSKFFGRVPGVDYICGLGKRILRAVNIGGIHGKAGAERSAYRQPHGTPSARLQRIAFSGF